MITVSTFISTRMSSSVTWSSAPNSNSPSAQLKKLKAASWICSRTACSSVARSIDAGLEQDRRRCARPHPTSSARSRATLSCSAVTAPDLTRRSPRGRCCGTRVGVVDEAVAEEDLAPLVAAPDGERPGLGAHLHQLEDVGETELLQVALEKHASPRCVRGTDVGPYAVSSIGNRSLKLKTPASLEATVARATRATPPRRPRRPRRARRRAPGRRAGTPGASAAPSRSIRRRSAIRAPRAVARAATPPIATAQRTPKARERAPVSGPPIGVLPRKTTAQSAITRPRIESPGVQLQQRVGAADEEHAGGADGHASAPRATT